MWSQLFVFVVVVVVVLVVVFVDVPWTGVFVFYPCVKSKTINGGMRQNGLSLFEQRR